MEGRKLEGKKTPRKDRIVRMQVIERRGEGADEELVKLCKYMRVMSDRDTDATVTQVLKTMMIAGRDKAVGGSELAKISGLNRITVIHHLKRLESAGLVKREETKYIMQPKNAEEMLLGFREDMDKKKKADAKSAENAPEKGKTLGGECGEQSEALACEVAALNERMLRIAA